MTWILQPECDCVPRDDLRSCDYCEKEIKYYSCLDYYQVSVTIPSDPYGDYAGTYPLNYSHSRTQNDITMFGSCRFIAGNYGALNITLQTYYHPYAPDLLFLVVVSLGDLAVPYGATFLRGTFKMIEYRNCEGHCNGTFTGFKLGSHYNVKYLDAEGSFVAWIRKPPGDFNLSPNRAWEDQREHAFPDPICVNYCPEDSGDAETYPDISVSFNYALDITDRKIPAFFKGYR